MKLIFGSLLLAGIALGFFTATAGAADSGATGSGATQYTIDGTHSQVMFKVKHLGISSVTGRFDKFQGHFSYDPKSPESSVAEAVIEVPSVNTNQGKRDEHLRSCDFFCTEKYTQLKFVSKKVTSQGGGRLKIEGDLTLHGVTKQVALDAEFIGATVGIDGKQRAGFSATTTINRKDFGLSWSKLTEAGGLVVGEDVLVTLEIQGVAKA